MKKSRAKEILEQTRSGRLAEKSADDITESIGGSAQAFISGSNKIPRMFRDKEVSLGSTIFLWIWLGQRFDELEKKVDQGISEIAREIRKLTSEREGQDKT